MKNLLVAALVCGMASLASAGLELNPTGDVPLSGSVTIDFVHEGGNLEGYDITLRVLSGNVTFSGAVLSSMVTGSRLPLTPRIQRP